MMARMEAQDVKMSTELVSEWGKVAQVMDDMVTTYSKGLQMAM